MARRSNGDGSVHHEVERNRWVGRLYVDGERRKVTARTRAEVVAKMNTLRGREASGEPVGDGNITVGEVLERWQARVLDGRDLAPSTREQYLWALRLVRAEFARRRLRRLSVDQVETGLDHIAAGAHGRPLARSSLARVRDLLVDVLDFAVKRRLVASNVARLAELTPGARAPARRRVLDSAQAAVLWNGLDGERLGALFRLQLVTGLRPGEATGLCWDAIDVDQSRLTVRRSVRLTRGRPALVEEVKAASFRTIGLPVIAGDVLRVQRRVVAAARLAGTWLPGPDLVFPSPTGRVLDPSNVRRELAGICRRLDLPVLRPNELRHTAATVLSDAGVPLELIADLLGHKNTRMLDQTYRHRVRPSVDIAVETMGALFGPVRPR